MCGKVDANAAAVCTVVKWNSLVAHCCELSEKAVSDLSVKPKTASLVLYVMQREILTTFQ